MKRALLAVCLAVAIVLPEATRIDTANAAATTITTHSQIPNDVIVFGCTEPVLYTGNVNEVSTLTYDANGGFHASVDFHPGGDVTATGLSTGVTYQATGSTHADLQASGVPYTFALVESFGLIGPGPDNNTVIQETAHITVNADGTTTVNFDRVTVACH